ncbi:MAG TPA: hypothetical protein VFQ68_19110 [Streptosporangiaceae bacterium]|nr:hypothetical protein [Streptosporangiaceae bacterium]
MDGNDRRVDGAVLADCLYLIGQAWVKLKTGDGPGAGEDLAAADRIAPPSAVRSIIWKIGRELPEPRPGPGGMDEWLEACRRAGAGELALTRVLSARELAAEEEAAFLARLSEIRVLAEAEMDLGVLQEPEPPAKPVSLADEFRAMGLM